MHRHLKTLVLLNILISYSVFSAPSVSFIPKNTENEDVEIKLEKMLNEYYDKFIRNTEKPNKKNEEVDIYNLMQGDQPVENTISQNIQTPSTNYSYQGGTNLSDPQYAKAMRDIAKEKWMEVIKENILKQIGRKNTTIPEGTKLDFDIQHFFNTTASAVGDDQITEKIRGFYPSCDMPLDTDQELWKSEDILNLFFNYDYMPEDGNSNIATATLRLYRIAENNTQHNSKKSQDCVDSPSNSSEDEKLIRVSVYWYTKIQKKRRNGGVKRRLADSKVVSESAKWVELNVKPATKAWSKGKNLGLAIIVDDQEGTILKADKYFKGASCMVGASTPKPIPTIIFDAATQRNEYNRISSLLGRNSTSTLHSDDHLLPTLDVCTLKFPDNYTQPEHIFNLRVNACNLKTLYDQRQKQLERERTDRITTLPEYLVPSSRHIRHQRQHMANKMTEEERNTRNFDPRSKIVNSRIIMTHEELRNLAQKLNMSMINR